MVASMATSTQELSTASMGLPVWDLVFEDHFDRLTCVPDRNGILRPNPLSWTPEIGTWALVMWGVGGDGGWGFGGEDQGLRLAHEG